MPTESASPASPATLRETPLASLHQELGARLVPFAGYRMPVQYPMGILKEHLHTRAQAGVFDVSHMGQALVTGREAARALERLTPAALIDLPPGRQRYSLLTTETGGILDDLMITHRAEDGAFLLVVNAAGKEADFAHIAAGLAASGLDATLTPLPDRALLALQGPAAAAALASLPGGADAVALAFMAGAALTLDGMACYVTRSGYTGEDGFEIGLEGDKAETLARRLLAHPAVAPIGLGARDSLRLEAGLCLYGADIDQTTTPVEAGLSWVIGKRRRAEGGFPGAAVIQAQIERGPTRRRVGLRPEGRAPVRPPAAVRSPAGEVIGRVTSGGFGPSLDAPVAMALIASDWAATGTRVALDLRGRSSPARVVDLPFVAPRNRTPAHPA